MQAKKANQESPPKKKNTKIAGEESKDGRQSSTASEKISKESKRKRPGRKAGKESKQGK